LQQSQFLGQAPHESETASSASSSAVLEPVRAAPTSPIQSSASSMNVFQFEGHENLPTNSSTTGSSTDSSALFANRRLPYAGSTSSDGAHNPPGLSPDWRSKLSPVPIRPGPSVRSSGPAPVRGNDATQPVPPTVSPLQGSSTITTDSSGNSFGSSDIQSVILGYQPLTKLFEDRAENIDLSGEARLNDGAMTKIAKFLPGNVTLRTLSLSGVGRFLRRGHIGEEGAKIIADALAGNDVLNSLDLGDDCERLAEKLCVADALSEMAPLDLMFLGNGLSETGFDTLASLYINQGGIIGSSGRLVGATAVLAKQAELGDAAAQCAFGAIHEDGRETGLQRSDLVEAARWYRAAGDKSSEAQRRLAQMHLDGRGMAPDDDQAATHFERAAKIGDAIAQLRIGWMLELGRGVPKDAREAVKWYRLSADQGNADAQYAMGLVYLQGHRRNAGQRRDSSGSRASMDRELVREAVQGGDNSDDGEDDTEQPFAGAQDRASESYTREEAAAVDIREALKYLKKAARQNHCLALLELGWVHEFGLAGAGLPADAALAAWHFQSAANLGHPIALRILGLMYEEGRGVGRNPRKAEELLVRAADLGDVTAQGLLDELRGQRVGAVPSSMSSTTGSSTAAVSSLSVASVSIPLPPQATSPPTPPSPLPLRPQQQRQQPQPQNPQREVSSLSGQLAGAAFMESQPPLPQQQQEQQQTPYRVPVSSLSAQMAFPPFAEPPPPQYRSEVTTPPPQYQQHQPSVTSMSAQLVQQSFTGPPSVPPPSSSAEPSTPLKMPMPPPGFQTPRIGAVVATAAPRGRSNAPTPTPTIASQSPAASVILNVGRGGGNGPGLALPGGGASHRQRVEVRMEAASQTEDEEKTVPTVASLQQQQGRSRRA
ncbi:hypothetical protein HK405_009331, partial [Cladochytrium tenue]